MLNIGICDDNISTTGKLEMMLQRLGKAHFIDIETDVFWVAKILLIRLKLEWIMTLFIWILK